MQVPTQPSPVPGVGEDPADVSLSEIRSTGARSTKERADLPAGDLIETIPVIQETIRIDKRIVETGRVLLHKTVREVDHPVELLLKQEELSVERVPVGRVVAEAPLPRQDGDVLIVPVLEEVLVVEKRLVLKEELHVRRKQTERTVRETVRLRTEEVTVEQTPAAPAPATTQEA